MFRGCSSLISLDLSNFDTSNIDSAADMFNGCSSLISLDLSNFNTSNIQVAIGMFNGCSSLISLDLSNFNTSNIKNAIAMFKGCSSLISLDLSNFDTSNIENAVEMFNDCDNLKYINLYNFKGSSSRNIFENLNTNQLTICINNESNDAAVYLNNAKKNCLITNLQLKINYCLKVKNIKYGLYINNKIIKLNKEDNCRWFYDIKIKEDNLIIKNILYKKNKIIRDSNLNITNIIETDTTKHTYNPIIILDYNFGDF